MFKTGRRNRRRRSYDNDIEDKACGAWSPYERPCMRHSFGGRYAGDCCRRCRCRHHRSRTWADRVRDASRHIAATQGTGCAALVRVPEINEAYVKRAMDAGAEGICFPSAQTSGCRLSFCTPLRVSSARRTGAWPTMRATPSNSSPDRSSSSTKASITRTGLFSSIQSSRHSGNSVFCPRSVLD